MSGAERVLVITHALWQRRYGGAPDAIGRRLIVDARPFTIVGVMPPDVEYPRGVEAWLTVAAQSSMLANPAFRVDVDVIARRRAGVTREQAVSELQALATRVEAERPGDNPRGLELVVRPYDELVVGDVRTAMLMLFAAVALVLLIASANVANLLLLRGEARRAELVLRAAPRRRPRPDRCGSCWRERRAGARGGRGGRCREQGDAQRAARACAHGAVACRLDRIDSAVVAFSLAAAFVSAALAGCAGTGRGARRSGLCNCAAAVQLESPAPAGEGGARWSWHRWRLRSRSSQRRGC